jgi:hypothetical protein
MFLNSQGGTSDTPFVQVGLIRSAHPGSKALSAFVAFQSAGSTLVFEDIGETTNTEHVVSIYGDAKKQNLAFDNRVVRTFARNAFFSSDQEPYFQFATEVHSYGDSASGYLRDIEIKDDHSVTKRHFSPLGNWNDRGVTLVHRGDRYMASGVFDARQ